MKNIVLLVLLLVLSAFDSFSFVAVKSTKNYTSYFDFDQSMLNSKEKQRFENFFGDPQKTIRCVKLVGHTDSKGTDAYNVQLSKARVNAIRKLLIDLGFDASTIQIEFKGEAKPIADNESDGGRAKNRRVDIEIEYDEPEVFPVDQELIMGDINDLYKQLAIPAQEFKIDGRQDTILKLKQGTLVMVSREAFRERNFTLKITEIYKKSDMILANLGTTSNGKMLESAGMLKFEAFHSNGKPLRLETGREITTFMPNNGESRSDMNFFEGQHDQAINSISWAERRGAMRRMTPNRFGWSVLINCDPICDFWCRNFGKKDFAIGRDIEPTRSDIKEYNAATRECLRSSGRSFWNPINSSYSSWEEMKDKYNVSTWKQLRDTLTKIQEQDLEERVKNGSTNSADLSYYVASVAQMGWINCDAFSNYPSDRIITMNTPILYDSETDGQLVFKRKKSIMKANRGGGNLTCMSIASGIAAWFVSIRFKDGKIFLAMKEVKTSEELGAVEFKEVSLQELKDELLKLDV